MRIALAFGVALFAAAAQAQPQDTSLDYEYFKTKVQPIFLAKRPGHARCVSCHASGTPLRLQPLAKGSTTWSEEDSRKNFEAVKRVFGRQREKPASRAPARGTGRRRLLSQRRQALGFPERSGVADPESVGDAMTRISAGVSRAAAAVLFSTAVFDGSDREGPNHPDQQRRRQHPRHRSRNQQGGGRHHRDRSESRRRGRAGRQPHLRQRRS